MLELEDEDQGKLMNNASFKVSDGVANTLLMVPTQPSWHEDAVRWERPLHRSRFNLPLYHSLPQLSKSLKSDDFERIRSIISLSISQSSYQPAKTEPLEP